MTKTATGDIDATAAQIARLEACGCDVVRLAVATREDALALSAIKRQVRIPLVADVHFDPLLAVAAIEHGADKVRVNPGNMKDKRKLSRLASVAAERSVPIRVGVNSGSVRERRAGSRVVKAKPMIDEMVDAAMESVAFFEDRGFRDLVLSLKCSGVRETIEANRRVAGKVDYPLHIGVTAAGTPQVGVIRNTIGIASLLLMGIGDTIRVSLTGPPEEEVRVGREILRSLGLAPRGIDIMSCPTCSRCEIDLVQLVDEVGRALPKTDANMTVAVMGCVVNGPGEAREADVGIVAGKNDGFLFRGDEPPARVDRGVLVPRLLEEVEKLVSDREKSHGGSADNRREAP